MHLARLWDSSRRADGGYSLEALTSDPKVMSGGDSKHNSGLSAAKVSMKVIFGKKKLKKDGSEGKVITYDPVEKLQREDRELWICYSALDSIKALELFERLKRMLEDIEWSVDGETRGSMFDFYEEYWRPFGALLVKMETEGMLVDRSYLSEMEKVAIAEQQLAAARFRKWASKYCADAKYMNVGSDTQIRQLFFGGIQNRYGLRLTIYNCIFFNQMFLAWKIYNLLCFDFFNQIIFQMFFLTLDFALCCRLFLQLLYSGNLSKSCQCSAFELKVIQF